MVDRIGVDTRRVLGGADLFKNLCDATGISVPPLQKILGVLVSTKLCSDNWQSIVSRAYPLEARSFVYQLESYPDKTQINKLKERPTDALHILGIAHQSSEAGVSGLYQQFCTEIGLPQNPTSQLLFFTVSSVETHKNIIWPSDFVAKIMGQSVDSLRKTLLPKIESFNRNVDPRLLHENYALLLSGMTFDLGRLDQALLQSSAFPCQMPAVTRISKQRLWANFFHTVNDVRQLRVNLNDRRIDPANLQIADELCAIAEDNQNYKIHKKETLREQLELATQLKSQFAACQLDESALQARARKEVDRLNVAIALARQKADQVKMRITSNDHHYNWKTPITRGMDSEQLHTLIGKMKTTLAVLELFPQTK